MTVKNIHESGALTHKMDIYNIPSDVRGTSPKSGDYVGNRGPELRNILGMKQPLQP